MRLSRSASISSNCSSVISPLSRRISASSNCSRSATSSSISASAAAVTVRSTQPMNDVNMM
jgi:hypothetical protein